jgi:uncharacterized membrane protein (UPF0127 family)
MQVKDGDIFTLRVGKGSRTLFQVEAVVSEGAKTHGLSGRPTLPNGKGMLFLFDSLSRQGMWMIDMKFPLDIVWLDEQFTIVHISPNCPPCPNAMACPTYSSVYRVRYAIEMTAGQAAAYGFEVGKQLTVV